MTFVPAKDGSPTNGEISDASLPTDAASEGTS